MFELPSFRYRYAKFSWAMFARPPLLYELEIYRISREGKKEPIPHIKQYLPWYRPPGPLILNHSYYSVEEAQIRLSRLTTMIAEREGTEDSYVASVHWIRNSRPDVPKVWSFSTKGRAARSNE
jgi:hypothetical protein